MRYINPRFTYLLTYLLYSYKYSARFSSYTVRRTQYDRPS